MLSDISQLKALQKRSSQSFHQQKKLIANLLVGKKEHCLKCAKLLYVEIDNDKNVTRISCKAACTQIELEH